MGGLDFADSLEFLLGEGGRKLIGGTSFHFYKPQSVWVLIVVWYFPLTLRCSGNANHTDSQEFLLPKTNKTWVIIRDEIYYNKKYESMDGCGQLEVQFTFLWIISFSHNFQSTTELYEPLSEVLVPPVSVTPAPDTLLILWSSLSVCASCQMRLCFCPSIVVKNKQGLRGFQHCGDQLKQSSPISAGKAQCHAAPFRKPG